MEKPIKYIIKMEEFPLGVYAADEIDKWIDWFNIQKSGDVVEARMLKDAEWQKKIEDTISDLEKVSGTNDFYTALREVKKKLLE